ncbi:MAG: hypothetical protein R3C14_35365 [Caldilineaceae bacterium]
MENIINPRYLLDYRKQELTLICDCAKEGQSLCFVGIAGTGKSNITNFLHSDPYGYKSHYLGERAATIHFPVVDGNTWDGTPVGLWKLLLAAINESTRHLAQPEADAKLIQISEDQKAFSELKTQVDWVCQQLDQQVMFILDDFDKVIQKGPLPMLEQLNALRSSGNRGKLSYLIFTKKLPHVLGRAHSLRGASKFYDLFSHHIYALGLYSHDDARQMVVHLNELAGKPLTSREYPLIERLAGGHARLIKIIFELWRSQPSIEGDPVEYFVQQPDVRAECERILNGLHDDEQAVVGRVALDQQSEEDRAIIDHLVRRGLLQENGKLTWFSPVFAEYMRTRATTDSEGN